MYLLCVHMYIQHIKMYGYMYGQKKLNLQCKCSSFKPWRIRNYASTHRSKKYFLLIYITL